jgi:hypothetical protein
LACLFPVTDFRSVALLAWDDFRFAVLLAPADGTRSVTASKAATSAKNRTPLPVIGRNYQSHTRKILAKCTDDIGQM